MKHKTWFRLVLKAIGIFLIATAIPTLVNIVIMVLARSYGSIYGGGGMFGSDLAAMISLVASYGGFGALIKLAIGLYLLLGGKAIVGLCIPTNRLYCPECGYELRVITGERCPECGTRLPADVLALAEPLSSARDDAAEAGPDREPRTGLRRFIPVHNRKALIGYYVAVASLIPFLGLVLGPAAVVYGIEGMRHARRYPNDGGKVHAWISILLGITTTLLNLFGWCLIPLSIL